MGGGFHSDETASLHLLLISRCPKILTSTLTALSYSIRKPEGGHGFATWRRAKCADAQHSKKAWLLSHLAVWPEGEDNGAAAALHELTRVQIDASIKRTGDWQQLSTAHTRTNALHLHFPSEKTFFWFGLLWMRNARRGISPWRVRYLNIQCSSKVRSRGARGTRSGWQLWQKQSWGSRLFLHILRLLLGSYQYYSYSILTRFYGNNIHVFCFLDVCSRHTRTHGIYLCYLSFRSPDTCLCLFNKLYPLYVSPPAIEVNVNARPQSSALEARLKITCECIHPAVASTGRGWAANTISRVQECLMTHVIITFCWMLPELVTLLFILYWPVLL